MAEDSGLIAGKHFPWPQIAGYFLRVESFAPFTEINGDSVGSPPLGWYGSVIAELPNPDAEPAQRLLTLPIEHKSDYKSISRAHIDAGIRAKTNELVLVYEHRRGIFGGRRASLHVAIYPAGTWKNFFDAVSRSASKEFRWPDPFALYQPSGTSVFPSVENIFQP